MSVGAYARAWEGSSARQVQPPPSTVLLVASPSMPTVEETLRRVSLFAGLDDNQVSQLAKDLKERRFDAGREVVIEGQGGIAFFIILEGEAAVLVGGQERRTLGPGDHFGETALFVADERRTATVQAKTDLRVATMTAWDFRPFVERNPKVAWSLLESLARRLADSGR
jgi:CRP-like cAMP-binding protein